MLIWQDILHFQYYYLMSLSAMRIRFLIFLFFNTPLQNNVTVKNNFFPNSILYIKEFMYKLINFPLKLFPEENYAQFNYLYCTI